MRFLYGLLRKERRGAVGERLKDVCVLEVFFIIKISDGAGEFQDAVVGTWREMHFFGGGIEYGFY